MQAPLPPNEAARLATLHSYNILDTPPEPEYDDFTRLAAYICQAPVALISLIDADRQWFKSQAGQDKPETPRDEAFCAHAILAPDQVMIVPDAQADRRFADNPAVTADPGIRFYAGAPLVAADGAALGTLCVIDHRPRQLTEAQLAALRTLSRLVINQLELRRHELQEVDSLSRFPAENPNPVLRLNVEGAVLYANDASQLVFGDGSRAGAAQIPDEWRSLLASTLQSLQPEELVFRHGERDYLCRFMPVPERGYVNVYSVDVTERRQAEEQIRTQLRQLESLRAIDLAIANTVDVRLTLQVVTDAAITALGVDAAAVMLLRPASHRLEFAAGKGFRTRLVEQGSLRLGQGLAGRAALERRQVHVPDLSAIDEEFVRAALFVGEGIVTYFGVPLIAKGQIKGALEIFHRTPLEPDQDWLNFLDTLAGQAAIAIDNAQAFEGLQRANLELSRAYDATIEGWSRAMDLRDKETEGHTRRVTDMTLQLARAAGLSDADLVHVRRGALLHDMGKLGIPDSILLKPGKLTDDEWVLMRQHPQLAHDMLASIDYLRPALDIPFAHHEKWDGTGYPRGLNGEQIPLAARLFAVVDVWDALRSDRPYRPAWPEEQVFEHIRSLSGTHFDPRAVELFFQVMDDRAAG